MISYAELFTVFQCGQLDFRLVEHKLLKTIGVVQNCQVDAPLLIKYLVDLVSMSVYFRKFHLNQFFPKKIGKGREGIKKPAISAGNKAFSTETGPRAGLGLSDKLR